MADNSPSESKDAVVDQKPPKKCESGSNSSSSSGGGGIKECCVCGDKALGYNFNAITCESCKAFFRRNALRPQEFNCPFTNDCQITVVSRRFCQKCRLRKCFDVGMKKECILTDEKLQHKRQQYQKKRKRRPSDSAEEASPPGSQKPVQEQQTPRHDSPDSRSSSQADTSINRPPSISAMSNASSASSSVALQQLHEQILKSAAESDRGCVCQCSCGAHKGATLPQIVTGILQRALTAVVQNELQPQTPAAPSTALAPPPSLLITPMTPPSLALPMTSPMSSNAVGSAMATPDQLSAASFMPAFMQHQQAALVGFTQHHHQIDNSSSTDSLLTLATHSPLVFSAGAYDQADRDAVNEVRVASGILNEPLDKPATNGAGISLTDVIGMIDTAIRRLIEMSKQLSSFATLGQEDQLALLKGGCTEMMILRGAMSFESETAAWRPNPGLNYCIKMDVLKGFNHSVYEKHKRFLVTFDSAVRTDETVMLLMTAMTLFNPRRPRVTHPDTILAHQQRYAGILQRLGENYLLSKYHDASKASQVFNELRIKLDELVNLNENAVNGFAQVDTKDIGPLLIEIFDLR